MKRILVTGNAGPGKSTLAGRIGSRLGIPCHSLDGVVWQAGWTKTPMEEKAQRIQELVRGETWVIDGVSAAVEARADTIVFLDVPRRVAFWRVAKRNWRYLFRTRPGLPPGCPELLIIPALCKIIWNFPVKVRPDILARMREAQAATADSQRHFHLKTETDLRAFLAALEDEKSEGDGR